jgi:hypothetical protein
MMASVHYMKAAPLVHAQWTKQGVSRHPLHAELTPALIQQGVHQADFFPQKIGQLASVKDCKAIRDRRRFLGRRHTFRHISEGENHQLQRPL